ncbi:hypothetical protein EDB81DRAFT_789519 [Dactylonectria macrodidyma]|uniref:LITAF domain-containing protein n=1 Tax=Dactylonectria macrodidyma TaxID=307937 RepID=A0A9P9JD42_9HYPO|nr:hypothetical protein EDB81DRAFT_789519 [Dactylonectria macrodidyma]
MSAPSPESQPPAQPLTAVSPPSYNSTPALPPNKPAAPTGTEDKIAYTPPVAAEGLEVQRAIDDDNLPEVVPQPDSASNFPEKVASPIESAKMADYNNNNNINNTMTPPPPFSSPQSPPVGYNQQQQNGGYTQPPNGGHIQPANSGYGAGQQQKMSLPPSGSVTPLHLLGNQGDTVDCPFCETRSMTRIEKSASWLTHLVAVCLFFVTFCGVLAPYLLHWSSHVTHVCENCGRKVASRKFGQKGMKALGTPEHLKQQSRFAVTEQPANVQQV